jgi:hypothetical protein
MAAARLGVYKMIADLWSRENIAEQIYRKSPVLGKIPKDTKFGEKIRYVTVGTSPPQGLGDFENALANRSASTAVEFQVQLASYYGAFSIGGDLWRRYEFTGNKAVLKDPMVRDSKGLMNQAKNDFSSFAHGNGSGALGRILSGSTLGDQVITLDKGADRRRIVKGMKLWASTTSTASSVPLVGAVTVASVGGTPSAPTITIVEPTWSGAIAGLTDTSYLFRAGAIGAANVFYGFDAWCPAHTGTPGTFLGVNRDDAPEQLAGISLSLTNKSPRQRIMLAAQASADSGQADGPILYALSTEAWTNLYFELSSANMLNMTKTPAAKVGGISTGVEYDAIHLVGPAGPMEVVADPWMPTNVERLLCTDTWQMASCGDWFHWDNGATVDSPMLEDTADARQVRAVGDHQMYCTNPWPNVRVTTGS